MGDDGWRAGFGGSGFNVQKGHAIPEREAQRFGDGFFGREAAGKPLSCSLVVAALVELLRGEGCPQVRLHRRVKHLGVLLYVDDVDAMNDNE